jgi:hypothetical protein
MEVKERQESRSVMPGGLVCGIVEMYGEIVD